MNTTAVIPFRLQEAKSRLSPLLSRREREELALVMLQDVLETVHETPGIGKTLVVTSSKLAAQTADRFGAEALLEKSVDGLNPAVGKAVERLMAERSEVMLVLPADIPLLSQGDIQAILSMSGEGPSIVIAPSKRDKGTNGLLLKPPNVIRPRYGAGSFEAHVKEASAERVRTRVYRSSTIGPDIDTPEDLADFIARAPKVRTYQFAIQRGLHIRLGGLLDTRWVT